MLKKTPRNLNWETCGAILQEDIWHLGLKTHTIFVPGPFGRSSLSLRLQSCLQRLGASSINGWPQVLWEHGCTPRLEGSCAAYNVAYHPRPGESRHFEAFGCFMRTLRRAFLHGFGWARPKRRKTFPEWWSCWQQASSFPLPPWDWKASLSRAAHGRCGFRCEGF